MKLEKQLKPHEQRELEEEHNRLAACTEKLSRYQTTEDFLALPVSEQGLLNQQLELQNDLLSILSYRIACYSI